MPEYWNVVTLLAVLFELPVWGRRRLGCFPAYSMYAQTCGLGK
jgi:hypothetical protein